MTYDVITVLLFNKFGKLKILHKLMLFAYFSSVKITVTLNCRYENLHWKIVRKSIVKKMF